MDITKHISRRRLEEICAKFVSLFDTPVCIEDTNGEVVLGESHPEHVPVVRRGLSLDGKNVGSMVSLVGKDGEGKVDRTLALLEEQIQEAAKAGFEIDELSAEIVHSYHILNVVYELNSRLGDVFEVTELCSISLDQTLEGIPADSASVVLKGQEPEVWTIYAQQGEGAFPAVGESFVDAAMYRFADQANAFLCDDLDNLPDGFADLAESPLIRFPLVWTPLRVKENTIGYILLTRDQPEEPFLTDDLKLFQTIATCAATVIQNVRLVRDLQLSLKELQERTEMIEEMQAVIMSTQKMSALGELAATVVHDIKNPLTVISAYAQLMTATDVEADVPNFGESILQATNQITQIVTKVLDFYRQKPPEKKVEDLNELIGNLLVFAEYYLSKFKKIGVTRHFTDDEVKVMADSGSLQEVFFNLIMNACHAMENGGQLTITTETDEDRVRINFTDTGCGIPADKLKSIFKPFVTTKEKGQGTGLGLAICERVVREHGGDIQVESKVGVGTTFRIGLPLV